MRQLPVHKYKRGFSLIEAAIVLAIVGLVIGGIWIAAAAVRDNHKVSEAAAGTLRICERMNNVYYKNLPNTADEIAAEDIAIAAKAVPESWLAGGIDLVSPIGIAYITQYAHGTSYGPIADQTGYSVYFVDVLQRYCYKFVRSLDVGPKSQLQYVAIGTGGPGSGGRPAPWGVLNLNYPLPQNSDIAAGCSSGPLIMIEVHCPQR